MGITGSHMVLKDGPHSALLERMGEGPSRASGCGIAPAECRPGCRREAIAECPPGDVSGAEDA